MNLVNKEVIHKSFGKGNVVNCDDSYIEINFESGDKKFVFPDVFRKHITFIDQKATELVKEKIEIKKEELRKQELILEEERVLEQERQNILRQREQMKNQKIHPAIQSVFWCEEQEEDKIFEEWTVFTGEIKSGKNKGQPRQFVRMDHKSACLLTKREDSMAEEDRQILGVFMANESFNGRMCEDGYIVAHTEYRLRLTEEESQKMLFWNYYMDNRSPDKTVWNSGKQRYFDNIWMAQILRDIASLRDQPEEGEYAQKFFEYFCKVNLIDKNQIPDASGALININQQ